MEDTPSTQSQAQPSNQKEELSQKQPEGESEDPRKCWHCNEPYGKEQDKCNRCHGFTMRTYERINGVLEKIEWRKLVVTSDDGDSYKRLEMREICRQIKEENSVAVFGRGKHDLGEERTKTVVLLYRPNGMKRLSYATGQRYATAKEWAEITEDEWKNFKIIVAGLKTESRYSCRIRNPLLPWRRC